MRARLAVVAACAGLLLSPAAPGAEPEESVPEGETLEGILAEPVDPDEEDDILADDDPDDVGQEALEPSEGAPPAPAQPIAPDRELPGVEPGSE